MRFVLRYIAKILVALDQLINTIFFGDPDETISSRAFRKSKKNCIWQVVRLFIDILFFFDSVKTKTHTIHHCELSFLFYVKRRHSTYMTYQEDIDDLLYHVKDYPSIF